MATSSRRDDHVYRSTRLLSVIIIPFLIVAWVILYLLPQSSGKLFAWPIRPANVATGLFIGSLSALLIGIIVVYLQMEARRRHS